MRRFPVGGQQFPGKQETDDAEWDVDPEQPPPVERVQDQAAEDRPRMGPRIAGRLTTDMVLALMTLPPIPAGTILEIVDDIFLPLVGIRPDPAGDR
jgi:hypothetical protein